MSDRFDWAIERKADYFSGYAVSPIRAATTGEEVKAMVDQDIRLYKAAPSLLEALKTLLAMDTTDEENAYWTTDYREAIDKARAAIAKAQPASQEAK